MYSSVHENRSAVGYKQNTENYNDVCFHLPNAYKGF